MQFCLPKQRRLRSQRLFEHLFGTGRTVDHRLLRVAFAKRSGAEPQVAFIAGKRVGGAVARNASKRILREFYRTHQHQISNDWDIAFVAKIGLVKASFEDRSQTLLQTIKRCGILQC